MNQKTKIAKNDNWIERVNEITKELKGEVSDEIFFAYEAGAAIGYSYGRFDELSKHIKNDTEIKDNEDY